MRSNKDRKLNLGTAFGLTIMNQFVKKNLDVKIHKLCNLANTEEIQCADHLMPLGYLLEHKVVLEVHCISSLLAKLQSL